MSRPIITPEMLDGRDFPSVPGHRITRRTERATAGPCYAFRCQCGTDDPGWWTESQRMEAIWRHLGEFVDLSRLM